MGKIGTIFMLICTIAVALGADSLNVNIRQEDSQMYHRQNTRQGQFDYGYHVEKVNNQFQHKVKGPDDVTYGCYGYIDPSNRKHLVYYVADRMGYRIIFPNRSTKIFTERVSDSLNKLDGSLKGKNYDEKVVEWNNLYLPDSCFRLNEILEPAGSASSVQPQAVHPAQPQHPVPVQPVQPNQQPELPHPSQYIVPPYSGNQQQYPQQPRDINLERPVAPHRPQQQPIDVYEQRFPQQPTDGNTIDEPHPQQPWTGSLPDINPANINLDQFSGQVYPIHTNVVGEAVEQSGGTIHLESSQYNLNITQLLAQIEAVNSQVITLNMLLAGMANNPTAFSNANENSCRSVVQLLRTQKRTPQLIYVPIMIPYTQGQYNINQPIVPAAQGLQHPQQRCPNCHN